MSTETDAKLFVPLRSPPLPPKTGGSIEECPRVLAGGFHNICSTPLPPKTDDSIEECPRVSVDSKKVNRKFQERKHLAVDKFEYARNGNEPGLILIFNQETFADRETKARKGSRRDVNEIILCFQRQGFNIDEENIITNATRQGLLDKLERTVETDLTNYNSLIVFVLTHGADYNKLDVFDGTVTTNEIWKPFRRCKTLLKKPKMFIFQACKGENFTTTGHSKFALLRSESSYNTVPYGTFSTSSLAPDMLVVYATIEGNVSYREPSKGSWFVQELCRNFSAYGKRDDVISLTVRTTKCVCGNYFYHKDEVYKKQMPMFVSTLTKKFYLNRHKDRALLLKIIESNEEILELLKDVKDSVNKLVAKDAEKKKWK